MTRPGRTQREILLDATVSLLALRYIEPEEIRVVKKAMADVDLRTTPLFKSILMDDRVTQARRIVLRLATIRFGPPLTVHEATVNAIDSLERLEQLLELLLEASSWKELLAQ